MFLKIKGHLLDVLGEGARGDIKGEFGIEITPEYQFLEQTPPVTLAKVIDSVKAEQLLHDNRVSVLETEEDFNNEIDNLYVERYDLVDSTALMLDLQLSGRSTTESFYAKKSMQTANLHVEAGLWD